MEIISWIIGIFLVVAFIGMLFQKKAMEEEHIDLEEAAVEGEEESVQDEEKRDLSEILNRLNADSANHTTAEPSNPMVPVATLLGSAVYVSDHPDFLRKGSPFANLLLGNKDFCCWLSSRPDLLEQLSEEQRNAVFK